MAVAFQAATDAQDTSGDGVITITHTATGSNLAAFAGSGNSGGAGRLGSSTYAGTAMVEMWDSVDTLFFPNYGSAGYQLAPLTSGSQSVVNTLVAGPDEHFFGVITMTGVDQTTPVGTSAFSNGSSGAASVTVGSVGADDLLCDNVYSEETPTAGADQTLRNTEDIAGAVFARQSTQPGTAGGVMSWTISPSEKWFLGAVAFKPVAAAGTTRGMPFASRSTAFNGGRTFRGPLHALRCVARLTREILAQRAA